MTILQLLPAKNKALLDTVIIKLYWVISKLNFSWSFLKVACCMILFCLILLAMFFWVVITDNLSQTLWFESIWWLFYVSVYHLHCHLSSPLLKCVIVAPQDWDVCAKQTLVIFVLFLDMEENTWNLLFLSLFYFIYLFIYLFFFFWGGGGGGGIIFQVTRTHVIPTSPNKTRRVTKWHNWEMCEIVCKQSLCLKSLHQNLIC